MITPFLPHKILWHPERVAEWLRTERTKPISWELDLTNKCNHACSDCPGGRNNGDSLDLASAIKYINQIVIFGGKSIVLTGGGEPLLSSILPKVIRYISYSKGLDVSLITNGSQLDKDIVPVILKHCAWIRVSLDAGSPEIFKLTHGCDKAMFETVVEGIRLLVETKKARKFRCTIGAAYLTGKETRHEMFPFTKLCKFLGVDYVQFRPYHFDFTDVSEELKQCERETTSDFSVWKSGNKYDHLAEGRPYEICYGHHFGGVINVHKVYLCCHFRGMKKYEFGDLRENTLEEIWWSERRKRIYENINYKDCYPVCRCDRFNRLLWSLKHQQPAHVNFV